MPGLLIAASVTRTELGLGPLSLEAPGTYRIVDAGPGATVWRRQVATSPYVHGGAVVSQARDMQVADLTVRAYAPGAATLASRIGTLLRAFEQFEYELTLTIDGVANTWRCYAADYAPGEGGRWDKFGLMSFQQVYRFQIPRDPIPIAGPS